MSLCSSGLRLLQLVGWVERSDTHHLSMRAARRWVSQGLNPSYELSDLEPRFTCQFVGWVERSDTHHLSMRAAKRWVSQGLNPSYDCNPQRIRGANRMSGKGIARHIGRTVERGVFKPHAQEQANRSPRSPAPTQSQAPDEHPSLNEIHRLHRTGTRRRR
jgi:hypothetical protein